MSFNHSDYHISTEKISIKELSIGDLFIPTGYGEGNFTGFELVKHDPTKNVLSYVGKKISDGEVFSFTFIDKVVRIGKKDESLKVRIVDLDVHSFASKLDYRSRDFQTYVSPTIVTYQVANVYGEFDPMPESGKGQTIQAVDPFAFTDFLAACPTFDFDLADFFAWATEKDLIYDYDETRKGGLVAFNIGFHADNVLSNKGHHYCTFEEAYDLFSMADFERFLATKKLN